MNKVLRNEIYKIALCSLFTVLTFAAGRLSFYIPVAGFPAFKFSLTAIPIVIGSFLLGPIYGDFFSFRPGHHPVIMVILYHDFLMLSSDCLNIFSDLHLMLFY